jgi:uncharacterized pyridoxamine 5'-phosphate oxidase family protein
MSKIVDFLNEAKTYYLATVEEEQPRVRPFGATVEYNGKVYFATNNQKKVYEQLVADPKTEISGMAKGKWIRLSGEAVFDDSIEAKEAMLEANPSLKTMYNVDDGIFAVFFLDNMQALVYSFTDEPVTLEN